MEERLNKLVHSKKFILWFVIVLAVLFSLFWAVLRYNENLIRHLSPDLYVESDSPDFEFRIESLNWEPDVFSNTKDFITISGWIIMHGVPTNSVSTHVVLKDCTTGALLMLPTSVIERTDVTDYFSEGTSYRYSGFSSTIPYLKDLNGDNDYEIYVLYNLNGEESLVSLNATIKNFSKDY